MTPILAAGLNNVVQTLYVSYVKVALTTGLYMLGLGIGRPKFMMFMEQLNIIDIQDRPSDTAPYLWGWLLENLVLDTNATWYDEMAALV